MFWKFWISKEISFFFEIFVSKNFDAHGIYSLFIAQQKVELSHFEVNWLIY